MREGGTGFALALGRRIVQAQQRHISLENQLGHGTTFVVELPVAKVTA